MNKKYIVNLNIIAISIISFGVVVFFFFDKSEPEEVGFGGFGRHATQLEESDRIVDGQNTKIFVVALDGTELTQTVEGELFGCNDKLLAVDLGKAVLPRDALVELFDYDSDEEGVYNAFINNSPIIIDGFNIENGTATVYLTAGGLSGGVCDNPRIIKQIKQTLLQFDNIDKVEIYFNDELIENYLSEKGLGGVLLSPSDDKIYFGAFPDFGSTEDNVTAKKIEEFNKLVGKPIAWAYFSNNWGSDGVKFPREKVEIIANTGAIPFVRLMPRKFFDTAYDKSFSLQKIIDGEFDEDLHQYASDVGEYAEPVLMDFAVEMNGDWFPWSGVVNGGAKKDGYGDFNKADGPERFVDAYRHIMDIFQQEGVTNITWFFHPDIYSYPENQSWNDPKEYYPGDDYIDWIGVSIYGPLHPGEVYWQSFSEIIVERADKILEISDTKPLALLEFGVTDYHSLGSKKSWISDAFNTILDKNNLLQFSAISWWHENWEEDDNLWATLRIDSSPESRAIFSKYIMETPRFTSELIFE